MQPLRDFARRELCQVLDSIPGRKGIVLDPPLTGPLGVLAEFSLLKDHGVEKVYQLDDNMFETSCRQLVYFCRPKTSCMRLLAAQVRHFVKDTLDHIRIELCFVPRRSLMCEKVLEEEGVYGEITIREFHLDFIPLEDDVLSLEMKDSFRELYVDCDTSTLFYSARAIMKLQALTGFIPRIMGKGIYAKQVKDILLRMRQEAVILDGSSSTFFKGPPYYGTLIIIDRLQDPLTPLTTQLTYEGLIDEIWGISNNHVDLDEDMNISEHHKIPLYNSVDPLFSQLRDLNFAVVGRLLNNTARRLNDDYEERHTAKTLSEIKSFIGKLGHLQAEHKSLELHTNLAQSIAKKTNSEDFHRYLEAEQLLLSGADAQSSLLFIEEIINRRMPLTLVLRLIGIMCVTLNGLRPKIYEALKKEIIDTYGTHHIVTLSRLAKAGIIFVQGYGQSTPDNFTVSFANLRRSLNLFVENVDEAAQNDVAYVTSGYAPISARFVQTCLSIGEDDSRLLNKVCDPQLRDWRGGHLFDVMQTPSDMSSPAFPKSSPNCIVFFLGGCTRTEITAMRYLSSRFSEPSGGAKVANTSSTRASTMETRSEVANASRQRPIVVATTHIFNGDDVVSCA